EKLANSALEQIKNRNYGGGYSHPLLLALIFNDEKRAITSRKGHDSLKPKLQTQTSGPPDVEEEDESLGPRLRP
ncbi:MAG: hypothetical protein LBV23_04035, partial [Deltaproteobacteria bacterium]|nr:hypothetical protein [Deltaproteobacteria bacterium]